MSIISEVKCARCDRQYSGLRSRCPYCGARRIGSGKYSEEGDNSRGKMIIGVLIMAVLVVAAGVLLFTTPKPIDDPQPSKGISSPSPTMPSESDNTGLENTSTPPPASPSATPSPSPTPTPTPKIVSVDITYSGTVKTDFTGIVGEKVPLRVKIEPVGIEVTEPIIWESSNKEVFDVVAQDLEGKNAEVTIIGTSKDSWATLTVYVGDKKAECIVRVKK